MKAVISVYKSEAVEYLRAESILKEDAIIITTKEDFDKAKGKVDSVHLISAPLGVSDNEEDLIKLLVIKKEVVKKVEPKVETKLKPSKSVEVASKNADVNALLNDVVDGKD